MSELWFVGAGLGDEQDLSERGRRALGRCGRIFAEEYTAVLAAGSLERIGAALGRRIERLSRGELEAGSVVLAALDSEARVGLLVAGDPFVATTHVALRLAVEGAGHVWRYVPNASVLSAAPGFLGLQSYRFGRTVSLPFPEPGFRPTSPIDGIRENLEHRLHTLVLLDLRPSEGRFLSAGEGLRILGERDPEGRATRPESPVAVVARLGSESARAWYGSRRALEGLDFGSPMHAVIVPSEPLHFEEEAAVRRWRWPPARSEGRDAPPLSPPSGG